MLIIYRLSDRVMVTNTGKNTLEPNGPADATPYIQRIVDDPAWGGIPANYNTYRLNDITDAVTVDAILNAGGAEVTESAPGVPNGVTVYDKLTLKIVVYQFNSFSAPQSDNTLLFPNMETYISGSMSIISTSACLEFYGICPAGTPDTSGKFIIQPDNPNGDYHMYSYPLSAEGVVTNIGNNASGAPVNGTTTRRTMVYRVKFLSPGLYTIQAETYRHGKQRMNVFVTPEYNDGSENGPIYRGSYFTLAGVFSTWTRHVSNTLMPASLANVDFVTRNERAPGDNLAARVTQNEADINNLLSKVLDMCGQYNLFLYDFASLYFDFYATAYTNRPAVEMTGTIP